jgi:hypothetical protein
MPDENDAVTEPDDDLSEAARQLGDEFLSDDVDRESEPTAEQSPDSEVGTPSEPFDQTRYSFAPDNFLQTPTPDRLAPYVAPDARFKRDDIGSDLTYVRDNLVEPVTPEPTFSLDPPDPDADPPTGDAVDRRRANYYDHAFAQLFPIDASERQRAIALLVGRARPQSVPEEVGPDWDRLFPELIGHLRNDRSESAAWWNALGAQTDVGFQLVVHQGPLIPIPPTEEPFDWDSVSGPIRAQFHILVPDQSSDGAWPGNYGIEVPDPTEEQQWQRVGAIDYHGDLGATSGPVAGAVGWNAPKIIELQGDGWFVESDESWEVLRATTTALSGALEDDLSLSLNRIRSSAAHFIVDRTDPQSDADTSTRDTGASSDPSWDALVEQAESRIGDSNLDHETGRDEESGTGLDNGFGRDGAMTPIAQGGGTLDNAKPPPPARRPPSNQIEALDRELAAEAAAAEAADPELPPTPPEESVLDYIDQELPETITVVVDSGTEPGEIDPDQNPITHMAFPDGLPEDFRRIPEPPPPVPPDQSVLDSLEGNERPRSGPTSPLQAVERELEAAGTPVEIDGSSTGAPDTPPARSVLDYIDQPEERPPSSPLEAVERELAAQLPDQSGRGRLPIWIWPAAAAAIVAIIAFVALSGGGDGDEPAGPVAGGVTVPTATGTLAPTTETTAAPAAQPTIEPTVRAPAPVAQIPTLVICPDGTSFSGYEQPDGSYLDAETGETHVCPPPPN